MSQVPAEFLGMARRLRGLIVATDVIVRDVAERIRREKNKRFERHLTMRPEALIDIERDWKTNMPTFGRIDQKTTREKKSLRIDEIRLVQSNGGSESWNGEKELGVIVARISLTIARVGATVLTQTPLAMVSLHALSRRFQRGFNVSDDDVIADLHPLAITVGRETVGRDFGYPVRDGDWKGVVVNYKENDEEFTVLAVRTFRGDNREHSTRYV